MLIAHSEFLSFAIIDKIAYWIFQNFYIFRTKSQHTTDKPLSSKLNSKLDYDKVQKKTNGLNHIINAKC